jgi:hypothetical protein
LFWVWRPAKRSGLIPKDFSGLWGSDTLRDKFLEKFIKKDSVSLKIRVKIVMYLSVNE